MGEIVDLMKVGVLCISCGGLVEEGDEVGYPRNCEDCEEEANEN